MSQTWKPNWSVPPGEILRETLREHGVTQRSLQKKTGLCQSRTSMICRGNARITPLVAKQLEAGLGIEARFWLSLESLHQDWLRRQREKENQGSA